MANVNTTGTLVFGAKSGLTGASVRTKHDNSNYPHNQIESHRERYKIGRMVETMSATKSRYAQAAANIKKELAVKFPGIKFSVRSKSFSMGNSVDVSWQLGPTSKEVDAILNKYVEGHFDGMTDCYEYGRDAETRAFQATQGSSKYVHGSRSMPKGLFERVCRDIAEHLGITYTSQWQRRENDSLSLGDYAHRAFSKCSFPAGAEYVGVASGWELVLTGACMSGDAIRIVHSKTDEEAEMRAVIRREFDRVKSQEQPQRLRLVS